VKQIGNVIGKVLPWLAAMSVFIAMLNWFPPGAGSFTWRRFIAEPTPLQAKLLFLAKNYLVPALLAFVWIVCFQLAMRARKASFAFVLVYVAAISMIAAWRSLALGPARLPGYALGIAIAQTLASRLVAVTKPERSIFGKRFRMYKIVWAGDREGVAKLRAQLQR
jgi:hypothetical protein